MRGPLNQLNRRPSLDFSYQAREFRLSQFRRLSNGTIDYDFYKARARHMRQAAIAAQMPALVRLVAHALKALVNWGTSAATIPPRALEANPAQ